MEMLEMLSLSAKYDIDLVIAGEKFYPARVYRDLTIR